LPSNSNLDKSQSYSFIFFYARKNFSLLDKNSTIINVDLTKFDEYFFNLSFLDKNKFEPEYNLNNICKVFGISAAFVQIIEIIPFKKTIIDIDNISIDTLYTKKLK
jgi:hypothetical protein